MNTGLCVRCAQGEGNCATPPANTELGAGLKSGFMVVDRRSGEAFESSGQESDCPDRMTAAPRSGTLLKRLVDAEHVWLQPRLGWQVRRQESNSGVFGNAITFICLRIRYPAKREAVQAVARWIFHYAERRLPLGTNSKVLRLANWPTAVSDRTGAFTSCRLCSGGHSGCRRGRASCRPETAMKFQNARDLVHSITPGGKPRLYVRQDA